jgi:hypothetical protein
LGSNGAVEKGGEAAPGRGKGGVIQESSRVSELRLKLSDHLGKKNNKIAFDFNGEILFIENDAKQLKAIRKLPSSNLKYSFRQQTEPLL